MAYLGILTAPIRSVQWEPTSPVAFANRSPWSGRSVVANTGNRTPWRAVVTPSLANETERAEWAAWMSALKGPINTFGLRVGETAQHAFTAGLTMEVDAAAGATTLYILGGTASKTLALAGQYITVTDSRGAYELLTLASTLSTGGTGYATAIVTDPLRAIASAAAAVETANPFAQMRIDGPVPGWSVDTGPMYAPASFTCSEAF